MQEHLYYQPLEIHHRKVRGFQMSLEAMRLPKETEGDSIKDYDGSLILGPQDSKLARSLIKAGDDHAKFSRGIICWMKISCQAGFLIEFETYRHGVECLSTTSSMHGELKGLSGPPLADQKQKDLSEKVYTRILHASYQALRSMYKARRLHRHPDWRILCHWIETLPYFAELIYPEATTIGDEYHRATVKYQGETLDVDFDFDPGEQATWNKEGKDDEYSVAYINGTDSELFCQETIDGVVRALRQRKNG